MQLGLGLSIANLNVVQTAAPYPDPSINWDSSALLYVNSLQVSASVQLTTVEQTATNNLVRRMKGLDPAYSNSGSSGIWNACKGLYPYVGSSLAAYKFNLMFPTAVTQATDSPGYPISPGYQYILGGITVDGIYGPKGNGINGIILSNLNWRAGYANTLGYNTFSLGAVYKTVTTSGRNDFGQYDPNANCGGIWGKPYPTTVQARLGTLEITATGINVGANGHWLLWRSGADMRMYNQGVQATLTSASDRTNEGPSIASSLTTWPWLGLNQNYVNSPPGGGVARATQAAADGGITYANNAVNFSDNTLMLSYIMDGFSASLIPAWNQIVEAFCVETGKKTW